MLRLLVLILVLPFTTISSAASAADAACVIFSEQDLGGAVWGIPGAGAGASSAVMSPWWQGRVQSVWLKDGYALDGYSEAVFFGQRLLLKAGQTGSKGKDGGSFINLQAVDKIASFRCHPAPIYVATVFGQLPWTDGAEYTWRPDAGADVYSMVTTEHLGSDVVVTASYHDGPDSFEVYQINLSTGVVKASTKTSLGQANSASFAIKDSSSSSRVNPLYQALAASAYGLINLQLSGMHSDSSPSAPAPELEPLAAALAATLWPAR